MHSCSESFFAPAIRTASLELLAVTLACVLTSRNNLLGKRMLDAVLDLDRLLEFVRPTSSTAFSIRTAWRRLALGHLPASTSRTWPQLKIIVGVAVSSKSFDSNARVPNFEVDRLAISLLAHAIALRTSTHVGLQDDVERRHSGTPMNRVKCIGH